MPRGGGADIKHHSGLKNFQTVYLSKAIVVLAVKTHVLLPSRFQIHLLKGGFSLILVSPCISLLTKNDLHPIQIFVFITTEKIVVNFLPNFC